MKAYRQGEILMVRLDKKSEAEAENLIHNKRIKKAPKNVIREGEKSGHLHEVTGDGQLYMFDINDNDKGGIIEAGKDTKIIHPEHAPVKLPPGKYKAVIQKEYSEGKEKKVRD